MMNLKLKVGVITVALLTLNACSMGIGDSSYSCPAIDGLKCTSTRDVYAITNNGEAPKIDENGNVITKAHSDVVKRQSNDVIENYVTARLPDRPIPIRTPAQVMRIWVAPWEDKSGDLIVTGFIYTEIESRRWVIGESMKQQHSLLTPLKK